MARLSTGCAVCKVGLLGPLSWLRGAGGGVAAEHAAMASHEQAKGCVASLRCCGPCAAPCKSVSGWRGGGSRGAHEGAPGPTEPTGWCLTCVERGVLRRGHRLRAAFADGRVSAVSSPARLDGGADQAGSGVRGKARESLETVEREQRGDARRRRRQMTRPCGSNLSVVSAAAALSRDAIADAVQRDRPGERSCARDERRDATSPVRPPRGVGEAAPPRGRGGAAGEAPAAWLGPAASHESRDCGRDPPTGVPRERDSRSQIGYRRDSTEQRWPGQCPLPPAQAHTAIAMFPVPHIRARAAAARRRGPARCAWRRFGSPFSGGGFLRVPSPRSGARRARPARHKSTWGVPPRALRSSRGSTDAQRRIDRRWGRPEQRSALTLCYS